MISPNAGKVLLGADGSPLRGASGKIVIADNLYPMVPIQQQLLFNRGIELAIMPDNAVVDIWDEAWNEVEYWGQPGIYFGPWDDPTDSSAWQVALQTTFTIGEGITDYIDWPRVKKLTQRIIVTTTNGPEILRVTTSQDNASLPTGFTIRDDWTLVADLYGGNPSATLTLEWVIDGVKPDSIEFAVAYTNADTNVYSFVSGTVRGSALDSHADPVRVVYNLAT